MPIGLKRINAAKKYNCDGKRDHGCGLVQIKNTALKRPSHPIARKMNFNAYYVWQKKLTGAQSE